MITTRSYASATTAASLLTLFAVGCAGNLAPSTAQQRVINGVAPDEVLVSAASLLEREFGRVIVDRTELRAASEPVEFDAARDTGTSRDLVGASTRMRRSAECTVIPRQRGALVRMRVDIDRQDTARRDAATQREDSYSGDDRPAYTPIERDAATTERQNTVWTRVRRDRTLERQLLDELADMFEPAAATATSAPARSVP